MSTGLYGVDRLDAPKWRDSRCIHSSLWCTYFGLYITGEYRPENNATTEYYEANNISSISLRYCIAVHTKRPAINKAETDKRQTALLQRRGKEVDVKAAYFKIILSYL